MIPVLFHLGPFTIYSFGVMAAAALVLACTVAYWVLRTRGVSFEFAYELLFVAGIGGFICVAAWSRVRHVPIGLMANAAGPAVAMGYAIGRIGCLLSGDGDYGSPTRSFIGIAFPHGTVPTPPGVKVWPTPPMETVTMLIVCWVLYRMAKRAQPGWYVWGWFMVLAGAERFLIEFIRRNPVVFLGLRTPQWESVASVIVGIAIILATRDREPVEVALEAARAPARGGTGGTMAMRDTRNAGGRTGDA